MKKLIVLGLLSFSATAFSQTCIVDMVNSYNNTIVRTFRAYDCIEAKKQCSKSVRLDYGRDPHASSLSCEIRNTAPVPPTNPNPYPPTNPNPYPPTNPNPYPPSYGSVETNSLILDVANTIYNSEIKTKVAEGLIRNMNVPALNPIVNICASTRTWGENASCLIDAVRRAPSDFVYEETAIFAVGRSCTLTTTWGDERNCFQASLNNGRFSSLGYLAQTCAGMYNTESAARCYRSVFGVQ